MMGHKRFRFDPGKFSIALMVHTELQFRRASKSSARAEALSSVDHITHYIPDHTFQPRACDHRALGFQSDSRESPACPSYVQTPAPKALHSGLHRDGRLRSATILFRKHDAVGSRAHSGETAVVPLNSDFFVPGVLALTGTRDPD